MNYYFVSFYIKLMGEIQKCIDLDEFSDTFSCLGTVLPLRLLQISDIGCKWGKKLSISLGYHVIPNCTEKFINIDT